MDIVAIIQQTKSHIYGQQQNTYFICQFCPTIKKKETKKYTYRCFKNKQMGKDIVAIRYSTNRNIYRKISENCIYTAEALVIHKATSYIVNVNPQNKN